MLRHHGPRDPMVPYRGGRVGFSGERGTVESFDATALRFARADGCGDRPTTTPIVKQDARASPSVTRVAWVDCRPGTSVTLYRIDGGGHALPGRAPGSLASVLGPSNDDIVGADVILDAFTTGR